MDNDNMKPKRVCAKQDYTTYEILGGCLVISAWFNALISLHNKPNILAFIGVMLAGALACLILFVAGASIVKLIASKDKPIEKAEILMGAIAIHTVIFWFFFFK